MKDPSAEKPQIDWKKIGQASPAIERMVCHSGDNAADVADKPDISSSQATATLDIDDTAVQDVEPNIDNEDNNSSQEMKMAAKTVGRVRSLIQKRNDNIVSRQPLNSNNNNNNSESSNTPPAKRQEDVYSGLELLDTDFLLSIIEDLQEDEENDVTMRKICFNEMLRRDLRNHIDSQALEVYAVDSNRSYGKEIQSQAMMELAQRTLGN
ncbi:MAG: hypothetical protein JW912_08430 [Sedimentisphaerales bacterium]|nr:hypothetical protein [Sedimentisphaerales bacterium]